MLEKEGWQDGTNVRTKSQRGKYEVCSGPVRERMNMAAGEECA